MITSTCTDWCHYDKCLVTYQECVSTMPTHDPCTFWLDWQCRLSWLFFRNKHYWAKVNYASTVERERKQFHYPTNGWSAKPVIYGTALKIDYNCFINFQASKPNSQKVAIISKAKKESCFIFVMETIYYGVVSNQWPWEPFNCHFQILTSSNQKIVIIPYLGRQAEFGRRLHKLKHPTSTNTHVPWRCQSAHSQISLGKLEFFDVCLTRDGQKGKWVVSFLSIPSDGVANDTYHG